MAPAALILAALVIGSSSASSIQPPPSRDDFDRASPERRVAMMDARALVSEHDPHVARARALLDRIDRLFVDDLDQMVEMTEFQWRRVREQGHRVSATEILEGATAWAEALPDGRRRRFSRAAMLYTTARERGLSHAEAIAALKEAARLRIRAW